MQQIPLPLDRALILRGQQKYDLFCTVCHGGTGAGNGITTQYGMNAPPSYHTDRLRAITDGEIFQVISKGKGQMGPYEASLTDNHPLVDPERPLEILRTIHSFDPCMACGVHVLDAQGNPVTEVRLR